jgi:hypothetical protein
MQRLFFVPKLFSGRENAYPHRRFQAAKLAPKPAIPVPV